MNKSTGNQKFLKKKLAGFTIIELLVAIVIIGILVGLVTVSYSTITTKTRQKTLENNLIDASAKIKQYAAKNNRLPATLADAGVTSGDGVTLTYLPSLFPNYCIQGQANGISLYMGKTLDSPKSTGCFSFDIQMVKKTSCPDYRTQVKDARDNNSYYIQKLADGNCWMLTNLAYAGGTANGGSNAYNDVINQGTGAPDTPKGTLSNGTADSSTTYTEAKYYIPPGANPTTDPTPPSTDTTGGGSGAGRQYGYLYNWCAAMGGQNTAACANATTPAPVPTTNICPAGWRLPTVSPTNEFTALNTAINGGSTSSDAGLLASPALFQRSGSWYGSFNLQGSFGLYWSSTQVSAPRAYNLGFDSTDVSPAGSNLKNDARAVRCVAEQLRALPYLFC